MGLTDEHSNARMHTVKPDEIFPIINIMDFYSTALTLAGPGCAVSIIQQVDTISPFEGRKEMEYKQGTAHTSHNTTLKIRHTKFKRDSSLRRDAKLDNAVPPG